MTEVIPNSTQVPNTVIDDWMPLLADVQFRIVMIVVRQTLGWMEDSVTKRRKEKDWISHSQLVRKTGRSPRAISEALKVLIDHYNIIEALNESGELLDTPGKRKKVGVGIFYRLNLHMPPPTLFDTIAKSAMVPRRKRFRVKVGDNEGINQPTIANFALLP